MSVRLYEKFSALLRVQKRLTLVGVISWAPIQTLKIGQWLIYIVGQLTGLYCRNFLYLCSNWFYTNWRWIYKLQLLYVNISKHKWSDKHRLLRVVRLLSLFVWVWTRVGNRADKQCRCPILPATFCRGQILCGQILEIFATARVCPGKFWKYLPLPDFARANFRNVCPCLPPDVGFCPQK